MVLDGIVVFGICSCNCFDSFRCALGSAGVSLMQKNDSTRKKDRMHTGVGVGHVVGISSARVRQ